MSMRDYIRTIKDLETLYYTPEGMRIIQKTDAPVLSTTTGVYNAMYGKFVWGQLNKESNTFGAVPKYVWTKSGWRVETARAASSGGGVAENGNLPDTIKETWAEVSTKPKTISHTFDVSETQEFLASSSDDDAWGALDERRPRMGVHHKEMMNVMLNTDVDTVASNNLESIDRVCSSYAELTNLSLDANDCDIYSLDRDAAASWTDAYVDDNSGTDRDFSDELVRDLNTNVHTNGGNTTFYQTGWDTYDEIIGEYQSFNRLNKNPFQKGGEYKVSVNGVETMAGANVDFDIAELYLRPLIISKNTVQDSISRIYALDTSDPMGTGEPRLGIKVAKPTQYFESGMKTGDPFGINRFGTEGMYRTMAELICHNFAAQGKIRDLQ